MNHNYEYDWILLRAIRQRRLRKVKSIIRDVKETKRDLIVTAQHITDACRDLYPGLGYKDQSKIVELLIKNGADVNARDKLGQSCLTNAIKWNVELSRYLLERHRVDPNVKDNEGRTAFYFAITENKTDRLTAVRTLVESGANVNAKCSGTSETPLMLAAGRDGDCCEYLLKSRADVDARSDAGNAAAHYALTGKTSAETKMEIVKLLRSYGSDMKAENDDGLDALKTIATCWVSPNHASVFEYLVNLDSFSAKEKADAHDLFGCVSFLGCNDSYLLECLGRFHKIHGSTTQLNEDNRRSYELYLRGIEMWKKAIEIRSGTTGWARPFECDSVAGLELLVQNPIKLFLHIVRKYDRIIPRVKYPFGRGELEYHLTEDPVNYGELFRQLLNQNPTHSELLLTILRGFVRIDISFDQRCAILIRLIAFSKGSNVSSFQMDVLLTTAIKSFPFLKEKEMERVKRIFKEFPVAESQILNLLVQDYLKFESFSLFDKFRLLLECGCDPNVKTKDGDAVLHLLLGGYSFRSHKTAVHFREIVDEVLNGGGHGCVRNDNGTKVHRLLKEKLEYSDGDVFGMRNLKCLAACAIVDAKIDYQRRIPKKLHKYMTLH